MSFNVFKSGCVDLVMQSLRDLKLDEATDEKRASVIKFQLLDNFLGERPSQFCHFEKYVNLHTIDFTNNRINDEGLKHLVAPASLRVLILANNQLRCPQIQAASLDHLDLSNNVLSDEEDLLHVCTLTTLTRLDLSSNKLSSLPQRFRKLLALKHVMLKDNVFKSFPRVLAALPKLTELEITICGKLEHWDDYDIEMNLKKVILGYCPALPNDKGALDWGYARGYLEVLLERFRTQCESLPHVCQVSRLLINSSMLTDDDHKHLEVAFRSLPSLQNLSVLSLCTNQLTRLPPYVEKFHELRHVGVCRNRLTEIPPQVRRLPKLSHLWITENNIQRVHFSTGDFVALEMLNLEDNPISNDLFEAKQCMAEWHSIGGNETIIEGLTVLGNATATPVQVTGNEDQSPSLPTVHTSVTSGEMQRDEVVKYDHNITIPKSVADRRIGEMQEKSVTRLKEFLELPDLRTTWRDLVLRFSHKFDRNYVRSVEAKVRSEDSKSAIELFIMDLQSEGVTVGVLIRELLCVHVDAAKEVSRIESKKL